MEKKPGKTLGIRADMDGLDVTEETGLSFASTNKGKMHACGHDSHVAMAMGAAAVLARHRDELRGSVKFIFQPGEEGPGGAERMIEDGALRDPKVDAIIAMHGGRIWPAELGDVGVRTHGPMMASNDRIEVKIQGTSGHGAKPHQAVDAISIAAHAIATLQTVISREIDPLESAVITIGKIAGGSAYNVIADEVVFEGTIRVVNPEVRQFVAKRIGEILNGVAKSMRSRCKVQIPFWLSAALQQPGIHATLRNNCSPRSSVRNTFSKSIGLRWAAKTWPTF